jgi:hypothetical protein
VQWLCKNGEILARIIDYQLVKYEFSFPDAKNMILSIETFWKVIGL